MTNREGESSFSACYNAFEMMVYEEPTSVSNTK